MADSDKLIFFSSVDKQPTGTKKRGAKSSVDKLVAQVDKQPAALVVKPVDPKFSKTQADLAAVLNQLIAIHEKNRFYNPGEVSASALVDEYLKRVKTPMNREVITDLDFAYDKKKLTALATVASGVAARHTTIIDSLGLNLPYSLLLDPGGLSKTKMVWGLACFFTHPDLYRLLMAELPVEVQRAAEAMAWVPSVDAKTLGQQLGESLTVKPKNEPYYSDKVDLAPMYRVLPHKGGGWHQPIVLSWPAHLRAFLRETYPKPHDYTLHTVANVPDGLLRWEGGDLVIFEEMQKLMAYQMMGSIAVNVSGKVSLTAFKKMQKQLAAREFYPKESEFPNVRTALLAQMLVGMPQKTTQSVSLDTLQTLERMQRTLDKKFRLVFTLNDLKNHTNLGLSGYKQQAEIELQNWMDRLPVGEWVAAENIVNYTTYHDLPVLSKAMGNYYELQYETGVGRNNVTSVDAHLYIDRPALLAGFFLFAALGWLDIVYEEPTGTFGKDYFSAYDGLRYVRINSLGASLFGRTAEPYAPKVNQATQELRFDEQSLLIFCNPDNKVAETVLANYAGRVSPTRFRVSAGTFLKGCVTKTQLQNKITLFSKSVAPKLPANWTAFFEELLAKAEPVKPVTNLTVFALTNTDPALIRLLAQDIVLKTLVIKAEGYRILVENEHVARFKTRLNELGYLL